MPNPTQVNQMIDRKLELNGLGPIGGSTGHWPIALYDPFELLPAATQAAGKSYNWDLDGAGTEVVAFATDGGGLQLTTTNSDNDSAEIIAVSGSQWAVARKADLTRKHWLSSMVSTGSSIASTAVLWGFKLTATNATASPYKTDADQLLIVYDTDGIDIDPATGQADISASPTNFYFVYSIGGSDYAVDSTVPVAASTSYRFDIKIGTDGRAQFYINNTLLHTTPVLTSTASFLPYFCIYTRTTAAKSHTIRWMKYLGA